MLSGSLAGDRPRATAQSYLAEAPYFRLPLQTTLPLYSPLPPHLPAPAPAFFLRRRVRPTPVFDSYWWFAAERQSMFFRRHRGEVHPWTEDETLQTYKFTNTYRAADRTSQYLIRHVIYRDDLPSSAEEVVFRIILFKLFNKIGTWEMLERAFGTVTYEEFTPDRYDAVLTEAARNGSIYNGAYIMPPGSRAFGHARKHRNHLALLEAMMDEGLPRALQAAPTMAKAYAHIRSYPTIGDFLAYQFVTDVNYSEVVCFKEDEFVVPGPGARSGLRKCFADADARDGADLIRETMDRQYAEFDRLGIEFADLWGRDLQLIDCQNLFCEVDKYARVVHPEVEGVGGRTRIKQKYAPTDKPLDYFFPPKWGINDRINETAS